jgi:hypothetical protein
MREGHLGSSPYILSNEGVESILPYISLVDESRPSDWRPGQGPEPFDIFETDTALSLREQRLNPARQDVASALAELEHSTDVAEQSILVAATSGWPNVLDAPSAAPLHPYTSGDRTPIAPPGAFYPVAEERDG